MEKGEYADKDSVFIGCNVAYIYRVEIYAHWKRTTTIKHMRRVAFDGSFICGLLKFKLWFFFCKQAV